MSKRQLKLCDRWAEQLAQASFGHLSGEESAALKAHLIACPACATVRADYLFTAAMLRQTPDPAPLPGLPPTLLQVWAAEAQHAPTQHPNRFRHLEEVPMQTLDNETSPAFSPTPPTRRRAGRRTMTIIGAIAAVLVIALVTTGLIASRTSGKPSPTGTKQTASVTSAPTHVIDQTWKALPHLANLSDETLLAPSDPSVVYQIVRTDQVNQASLRRSDDQGATWKNLPAPAGAALTGQAQLYISPANAQHVLLINGIYCSSGQAAAADTLTILSSGNTCSVFYISTNGGESWAPVTIPAHGSRNLFLGAPIVAQQNRLYAFLVEEPGITASELVVSSDDGATWHFADQGLDTEQHCLEGFTATPTGTTLFAATLSHCGGLKNPADAAQIWRSDDAGAQWTPVSTMPAIPAGGLEAIHVSGQAQPVLVTIGLQKDPAALGFSLDNGKTWQPVPTLAGQASGQGMVGVRSDGSILALSKNGLYTWKVGDAGWHKVGPTLAGEALGALVVFDKASGKETLYLEMRPGDGNIWSFYGIDLN